MRSSTGDSGKPAVWVGIGVAGGFVAPALAVWRSGAMCQPSQQQVNIVWRNADKKGRAASVYAATGPLVAKGLVGIRV